jgi:hypothetical protein
VFEIAFHPVAEDELLESHDWYEEQLTGLGNRFYAEVSHYLTVIQSSPLYFPVRYDGDIRAFPLKKFPFLLIYLVDDIAGKIIILSVFHTSREPKYF